jgi:hypothetical protein
MITAVARHRRVILTGGLAAALAGAVAAALLPPSRAVVFLSLFGAMAVSVAAGLAAGLAAGVSANRRRPATLGVTADGAFASPRMAPMVFFGLALTVVPVFVLCGLLLDPAGEPAGPGRILLIIVGGATLAAAANAAFGMWRGIGVRLTPAGITADLYAGTLLAPWDALDAAQPRWDPELEFKITLAYARPELVTARGLVLNRREILFEGVDGAFLAAVVAHYAADPAYRPAIGTAAELDRLRGALLPFAALPPAEQAREEAQRRRSFRRDVAIGIVLAAAAVAAPTLLPHSTAASIVTGLLTATGGAFIGEALRRRRAVRRAARGHRPA